MVDLVSNFETLNELNLNRINRVQAVRPGSDGHQYMNNMTSHVLPPLLPCIHPHIYICDGVLGGSKADEQGIRSIEQMVTTTWRAKEVLLSLLVLSASLCSSDAAGYTEEVRRQFMGLSPRAGSRLLQQQQGGSSCDANTGALCPVPPPSQPPRLVACCGNRCRDVLSDRNNCGACGSRCGFGQLCCGGQCTSVAYDVANCGACDTVCPGQQRCEYGACGYA